MTTRILIYGVSGAGKTALQDALKTHGITTVSAGELIRSHGEHISRHCFNLRSETQAIADQQVLVQAFDRFCKENPDAIVSMDAHLELRHEGGFTRTPETVTEALKPSGMVFLATSPEVTLRQRMHDTKRTDRAQITLEALTKQIARQLADFEHRARQLGIPALTMHDGTVEERASAVRAFAQALHP